MQLLWEYRQETGLQDQKKKGEFETQRESSAQVNYVKEEDYLPKSDHATLLKGGLEKISKL